MNPYAEIVRAELGDVAAGAWRQAGLGCFVPRPRQTVSEWADAHRVVVGGPEPGRWRTTRTPYLRQVLDAISDPDVERVVLMCGAQMGKSSVLENAVGFFAHADPSAALLIQPTEGAARAFSKERIAPMFAASPALRPLVSDTRKDADATITLKMYPGGFLAVAWASSSAQLASRPIRVLLADEIDRWPTETGNDGDPYAQAVARTSTFGSRRKIVAASTPTLESSSRIAKLYDDSDQRRYHVPCPHCGVMQPLDWSRLIYKDGAGAVDLDQVHYQCEACDGRIEERHRPQMLVEGCWAAHNPGHPVRGYHLSALYSPWATWRELAAEWVRAVNDRDLHGKREFYNLRLGETWTEQVERVTVEQLETHREQYDAELPDQVLLLTAGVDVQDNRLEVGVVGWGAHRESWAIEYAIIAGDTGDLSPRGPWQRLDEYVARTWVRAGGAGALIACVCIDSGGHRTDECYTFARDRIARNIFPIHGVAGRGRPIVGKALLNKFRAPHYAVGVDTAKEALYARLALAAPGPGYVHFPIGRGFDDEYFRGLLSERLAIRRGKRIWEKTYRRNEPLDVAIYATAAMEILVGHNPALLIPTDAAAPQPVAAPRRRVLSPGVTW